MIILLLSLYWYYPFITTSVVVADSSSQFHKEITFEKGTTDNEYKYTWMIDQRMYIGNYYVIYDNNYYWYEGNWTVGEAITIILDSLDLGVHNITAINYGLYTDTEGGIFIGKTMILVHVIPPQPKKTADSSFLLVIFGLMIAVIYRSTNNKKI